MQNVDFWNLSASQILSFGRVYKIEKGDGFTLRWFMSDNDYIEHDMILDDKYDVQYFFIDPDIRSFTTLYEQDIEIYFFINITTVKPGITHRADEEIKQDIHCLLRKFEGLKSIEKIKDLPGYTQRMDMQPYHSFKAIITIKHGYEKTI